MRTLVSWLATIVRKAPAITIIVVLVLTAVFAVFAPQVEMTTGIEVFVPDNPELRALDTIEEQFGTSESTIQVLIASDSGDVITAEGVTVAQQVEAAIRGMDPAVPLSEWTDPPIVSYLTPTLGMAQYMGVSTESLSDQDVKAMFTTSATQLSVDQELLFGSLVSTTTTDWDEARTGTGLMVVFLDTSGLDFAEVSELQSRIVAVVDEVQAGTTSATGFSEDLLLSVDALSDELMRLFGFAAAAIVVILATVYWIRPKDRSNVRVTLRRSLADLGLTLAAIGISITWMLGLGVLLGPAYLGLIDDFSPVLQVLPVLLIGLGVDFAIHLTARYREELGRGREVAVGAERATITVGIALILATLTTAVGFLTNVVNPIPPIKDFGILAAIGIIGAFVVTLTFVPAARSLLDRRAERRGTLPRAEFERPEGRLIPNLMGKLALVSEHFAIPTLVVALALTALGAFGMAKLPTEFGSTDFVPKDDPLALASETLTEEFGGGIGDTVDVLIEGSVATPEFHNALVVATVHLADTDAVVTVDGQAAALSPLSVVASLLEPDESGTPADPEFAAVASANGLQADLTVVDDADVAAVYDAALEAAPDLMSSVLSLDDEATHGYARVVVSTQAGEDVIDVADELVAVMQPLADLPTVSVTATSVDIMTLSVVMALQDSQSASLVITLAAAMLLLVAVFWTESRRPFLGVITILPVVFVVLWTYGMMAVLDIPFGPVTAMTSALAIGIGVPYSIHVTHRYLEDRARFDDPVAAMRSTTGHTGGALLGSALTTLAGFGVLMTSALPAFKQFGAVTTIAIGFSLVAAVGVLPSMLSLWDRWHARRGDAFTDIGTPADDPSRRHVTASRGANRAF